MLRGRLPAEEGAVVLAALAAGRDVLRRAGGGASAETPQTGDTEQAAGERRAVSNADSLLLMADTLLASGPARRSDADRCAIVLHADAEALAHGPRA